MKRLIGIILAFIIIFAACDARTGQEEQMNDNTKAGTNFIDVDSKGFEQAMTGDFLILDVRTQQEYDSGHLDNALLIPHTVLEKRISEIKGYDSILVYCRSGNRSQTASQILIGAGINKVYNLLGGINAWQEYKDKQS